MFFVILFIWWEFFVTDFGVDFVLGFFLFLLEILFKCFLGVCVLISFFIS